MDKAGRQYWDKVWGTYDIPKEVNPRNRGLANYVNRCFHEYFCKVLSSINTREKTLLEIGCARSAWLPYFAKEFGFKVYGIDYSEIGCQQAIQILENEGVNGKIVCADFFSPLGAMLEAFDVVVSFGVLEHFKDTTSCIETFSKFLKPGGLLITNIPNLCGLNGLIQKVVNRSIFDIHVPLDKRSLVRAHQINGLRIISCNYFLFANFGALNLENLRGSRLLEWVICARSWFNNAIWTLERVIPFLRPNRWSSPYINCGAIKA